ncbi:MAG: uridylate kinase [Firmicutes bacterium]|nr:uridylate kinase [Bacillota bacterium]
MGKNMQFETEIVGKIGSMALVDKAGGDIDYNRFARISRQLKPGMVWVSSGATEIGRLDYLRRAGHELTGDIDRIKTDYAAQGQAILMQQYRQFIDQAFSVRQVLVEHNHFNNSLVRAHLKELLLRCREQNAVPVVNYNDAASCEENRKMEIQALRRARAGVVELVDNDETASQIACLLKTRYLIILTSADGIYADPANPATLIREIGGRNADEVVANIDRAKAGCKGASRAGAAGAAAKLEFAKAPVKEGTTVFIAGADCAFADIISGAAKSTKIGIG